MEVVLDRLPTDAVEENPDLVEIRRSQSDFEFDEKSNTWVKRGVVGTASRGSIRVFDDTMSDKQDMTEEQLDAVDATYQDQAYDY